MGRFSPELNGLAALDGQAANISALDFLRLNQAVPSPTPTPAPVPTPAPTPTSTPPLTTYADLVAQTIFSLLG